jgi:hypothetical protein
MTPRAATGHTGTDPGAGEGHPRDVRRPQTRKTPAFSAISVKEPHEKHH